MSTHKLYLGCVSFYRKRYSGLPSLQNKCFLFRILLNWRYTLNISIFFSEVHFCWTLNCQMFPNSAGPCPLYCTKRWNDLVQIFEIDISHFETGCLLNGTTQKIFGFSPSWRDLSCEPGKKSTNPETKAQACCVTNKCWRAFCMSLWDWTEYASLFVVMWLLPTLPIFF